MKLKKIVLLSCLLVIVLVIGVCIYNVYTNRLSFDDITNHHMNEIANVAANESVEDLDGVLSDLMNASYVKSNQLGTKDAAATYVFYDDEQNVVFMIRDLGFDDLYQVLVDDTQFVYHMK